MGKKRSRRKKKAEAPEPAVVKEAEKLAEAIKAAKKESPSEANKKKSGGKKGGSRKRSRKKKGKGGAPQPKRGFRITSTVLDILLAVKRFGEGRDKVNEIYEATGRNTHRTVKGKSVMTKKYEKWKAMFEKLKEKGYIVLTEKGYRLTPAGHRLLRSRYVRMGRVPNVAPRKPKRERGKTVSPARRFKSWGVINVDKRRDKRVSALPPGKRISKSGRVYYEYRPNRSDIEPEEGL